MYVHPDDHRRLFDRLRTGIEHLVSYDIKLRTGLSVGYLPRRMANGVNRFNYNVRGGFSVCFPEIPSAVDFFTGSERSGAVIEAPVAGVALEWPGLECADFAP